MTGPEHYREAERLSQGAKAGPPELYTIDERMLFLADAQVHATLALAAATALAGERLPFGDFAAWNEVAGVPAGKKAVNGHG